MQFSENLKKHRIDKKMTQEELAVSICVSKTLISNYEASVVTPTKENIQKIANVFGVSVSDLIGEDELTFVSLEYSKKSIIGHWIFEGIAILVCFSWSIIACLPIFSGSRYVYPIPDGQNTPDVVHYTYSLISASVNNGFPYTIIALAICLVEIGIAMASLITKRGEARKVLKIVSFVLFPICIVMMFVGIVFGITNYNY
jgi:transcriptional regulator with XRE-family HTH domain